MRWMTYDVAGNICHTLLHGSSGSMLTGSTAWTAGSAAPGEWLQMDMGAIRDVTGIVLQMPPVLAATSGVVSRVKVQVGDSPNNLLDVPAGAMATGMTAANLDPVELLFPHAPIQARYVRVVVLAASGSANGNVASLRAAVLAVPTASPYTAVIDPPVSRRTYSGSLNDNTDSMMESPSVNDATNAWIADKSSSDAWMRIDLGSLMEVKGVVLAGPKNNAEFATKVGPFSDFMIASL